MQRRFVLGAALGLLAALALSRVGAAAPPLCGVGNVKCGHVWNGVTSQGGVLNTETGGAITFATNQADTRVGNFQWAISHESCSLTATTHVPINMGSGDPPERGRRVRAGTASVPINMGYGVRTKAGWQARVLAGHFSKSWTLSNPVFATRHLPTTVVWHLSGTLSGKSASGTMQWSFAGPNKNACSPSSGRFTWHAVRSG
jgi:hypothetical protein